MKLTISNLTKRYGSNKIGLSDFSMNLSSGILGVLGPNGAGKFTLIKMISTICKPSAGSITINGEDIVLNPNSMRKVLGYLPQNFGVYPNLNAYEFLSYIAAMKGMGRKGLKERIETLLDGLNLIESAKNHLGTYSGGMIQRLGIAQTLLNNPKIIIFDEPTVGLDPVERLQFRDLISDLASDKIIILSSHIVSDIESITDVVAIMQNGTLLYKGNHEDIIQLANQNVFVTKVEKENSSSFKSIHTIINSYRMKNEFNLRYISETQSAFAEMVSPTLEYAYIFLPKN